MGLRTYLERGYKSSYQVQYHGHPRKGSVFVGPKISGFFPGSNPPIRFGGMGIESTRRGRPDSYGMVQYWDVLLVLSNWGDFTPYITR